MIFRYIISIFIIIAAHIATFAAWTDSGRKVLSECVNCSSLRQFPELLKKASELERIGRAGGNREEEIAGKSYRIRALIHLRDKSDLSNDIEYLKSLVDNQSSELADPNLASNVARTVSLYYQYILSDYSQASLYAFKALDAARKARNYREEVYALSAIASTYFQKQDSTGYSYALEAYNMAKHKDLDQTIYTTACNMANYLYNRQRPDEALKYLNEAAQKAREYNMTREEAYINSFFGDIYNTLRYPEKAEEYYKKSLAATPGTSQYDIIYARMCYAMFLTTRHRWDEALSELATTEKMMDKSKIDIFRNELYRVYSMIYEAKGDHKNALASYKKYMEMTLDLFSEAKEKEFAILDLRYRIAEEKTKNSEQRLQLMQRDRITAILVAISAILVLLFVAGYLYYIRRSKYYKTIIAQYLDNAKSERELRSRLETALAELKETQPRSSGSLNEEKANELFLNLERLMKEEHIYRDCNLSLNSVAAMLSTNRTYLSQVVNSKAEKSFAAYVNDYRLDESVELLMDPSNQDSLKTIGAFVGFSSPSNFYSLFRQRVGVSPSVFRSNYKNASDK